MGKKPLSKAKKTLTTEPTRTRKTHNKPACPFHSVDMEYEVLRGVWHCTWDGCTQIAFPPEVAEKGKPIIVTGELELVHTPDPGGSKAGRWFLRSATGASNTLLDITDHLDDFGNDGKTISITLALRHMTEVT